MKTVTRATALARIRQLLDDIHERQSSRDELLAVRQALGNNPLAPTLPGDPETLRVLKSRDDELSESIAEGLLLIERLSKVFVIQCEVNELDESSVRPLAYKVLAYLKEGQPDDDISVFAA